MSYNKSCNVDVLKTYDLRVRPVNNISPGLYSTLAAGPQEVYGSPLTWQYILLISDIQNIKVIHSTIISNEYLILSTNVRYISTYLDNTVSTLSSFLYTNFINLQNTNVYLQGSLLHDVSNFYEKTNAIPYPSTFSTIISNFSTLSTVIRALIPTLTYMSTTSTLYRYEISTIQTLSNPIRPLISTLSSLNNTYSTLLYRNLKQSESNLQSTVTKSVLNYLSNQSTTFNGFQSTLSNTSSYIYSAFSSQYFTYSTINGTFLNQTNTSIKADFSSFSTIIGYQFSSVDVLYSASILGSISTAEATGINTINSSFQTVASSISKTYSTLKETISTQNNILDYNNSLLAALQYQYITYQKLSTQVVQLSFYSTISRPQLFFELDFYLNNIHISTYYLTSSISSCNIQINQSIAAAYLENQFKYNSTILSSLFASNTSNAYYNIIKAYRANNISLIDTISNSISNFINPSSISTAYGQYSTQVKSSITQTYKIVVQSERLAIRNTCNVYTTADQSASSRSSVVGSAFLSLSNEMGLITSTSFNNLISYTFASFRSNSELTLRALNQAETSNNSVLNNYITTVTDHTIQDAFFYNLSTLFSSDFSTTKKVLTSTTISLLNSDSTFIRYFSTINCLSTFFYSNTSSFQSTLNYSTSIYSISSLSTANAFNLSTLSSFDSYLGPMTSSISTYLTKFVYSTLSTYIDDNYSALSNLVVDISGNLFSTLHGISNRVNIYNASQGYVIYSSIIICNTQASNILYNIYCNSINLSINQVVMSTFTTLSSIYVNAPMSIFEGGATYKNYLASISTLGSFITYNYSSFSTATSTNFLTLSNYSTFNYSSFSSFVVSPYLVYNLSSFSTPHTNAAVAISSIQFSPYNKLNYSTFNMSTMSTLGYVYSSIMFSGAVTTIEEIRSPLQIEHYDRQGIHNLLYVNPTKNEVVVNNLVINGMLSVTLSNTISTLSLDLNKYQNFYAQIQTMSNANPTIELNVALSTVSKYTQQGYININISPASANEIAAKRFLNIINLGPTIRLNITNTYGYLRYKYLSINGKIFISQNYDFTKATSAIIPAGIVNTITNTNNANFIGLVTDSIGNLYATDINTNAVLKYDIISGTLNIFVDGFSIPYNLTIDSNNNLYVTSFGDNTIYKVTQAGVKTVVCTVSSPVGIVVDSTAQYLYVSSLSTRIIYQVKLSDSSVTAFVGSGAAGYSDGIGPAATFGLVFGMTIDSSQTMYLTDYGNNSIRKIVLSTKSVTTISGSILGLAGNTIDLPINVIEANSGSSARFNKPTGIVADNLGNLFVCDSGNYAIRRIIIGTGDIITISGREEGYLDGSILDAKYKQLYAIVINAGKTNLYACDLNRIRQVGYNINAITGNSATQIGEATILEAATRYAVTLLDSNPNIPIIKNCVVDSNHKLFLLSATGVIYKYDVFTQSLTVLATLPTNAGYGLTISSTNILYATDGISSVFSIATNGSITTIFSYLSQPRAVVINSDRTKLYVGCSGGIFELTLGSITTSYTFSYTGGTQTWTPASDVTSVFFILKGAGGGCYADYSFNGSPGGTVSGVLSVTPAHTYTIVVGRVGDNAGGWWTGSGGAGFGGGGSGNGGQYGGSGGGGRSSIQYTAGTDIVTAGGGAGSYYYTQGGVGGDPNGGGATNGTPYQGDTGPYTGGGGGGYQGGGPGKGGTSYINNLIGGLATAGTAGNGFHLNGGDFSRGNGSIDIISGVKVLAGSSSTGYLDGVGLSASLDSYISGLILYTNNILYFSEFNNQLIRKLTITTSNVVTVSGTAGTPGSANGLGKNAQFNGPQDIKTDLNGNLYVSDLINNAIRKIDITSATVTTLIGNMGSNSYPSLTNPDGILNQAKLFGPYGIAFDNPSINTAKDLYVIDGYGKLIRSFYATSNIASFPMSTIINYDNSSIFGYKSLISTNTIQISTIASQTYTQYLNTVTAYNNTLTAPDKGTLNIFITAASNAVLNAISQSNIASNASTNTSLNYLSVITISTNASAEFTTVSYNANVYLSNASNLFVASQSNSNSALSAFNSASDSAVTAADAYSGAVIAGTQSNTEVNFAFTGFDQVFVVPAGVTKITVELLGAGGSTAYTGGGNGPDAQGGYVYGDLAVTAGQTYTVVVGGQNNNGYTQYGGGGAGSYSYGGSGGGRSALVLNGLDVVTAGGGGGDAYYTPGGLGGGLVGQNGYYGAGGGTQSAGGAASGYGAQNGSYQYGGNGAGYGAGGGGGYYGGGGGGGWQYGGGGGSSYVGLLTGTVINTQGGGAYAGYHASQYGGDGHGRIKITYSVSSGGGTTFTGFPLTISNCVFWFDASDTTTITASDGYSVTGWKNKGSTGGSASIGGGTPVTNTVNINGLNAISFGANTYMNFRSAIGGNPVTFFCVTRVTSDLATGFNTVAMLNTSEYGGFTELISFDSNSSLYSVLSLAHNVVVGNSATTTTIISGYPTLFSQRSGYFSGNSGSIVTTKEPLTNLTYVNGIPLALQQDYNTEYPTASVLYTISASYDSSQDMGELILYNRALTSSEIIQTNLYLLAKWSISYIPLFDPSEISGMIVRSDAYTLTEIDGTVLSVWPNTGSGGTVTCTGVVYTNNTLNGLRSVTFNTSQIWSTVNLDLNSYTIFFVGRQLLGSYGTNARILEDKTNGHNQLFGYWGGYKQSFYLLNDGGNGGDPSYLNTGVGSDTVWDLMSVTVSGTPGDYTFKWNGTSLHAGTTAASTNLGVLDINLYEPSDCQVAEIIVYNTALSESNVSKVEGYLSWKWGLVKNLPTDHLYKNSPPGLPAVSSPLIIWFDGNVGLTTTSWTNRGTNGSGGNATLSGVTITTQNGLNAASFTGVNTYGSFTPTFTGNSRAVFAVYRTRNNQAANTNSYIISQTNSQGPYWYVGKYVNPSGNTQIFQVMAGNQVSIITDPAVYLVNNEMAVVGVTYDENGSTNSYTTVNGSVIPSSYTAGSYYNLSQISYLNGGGNSGFAAVSSGSAKGMILCELLIYDGIIYPADACRIATYLGNKWGITVATCTSTGT